MPRVVRFALSDTAATVAAGVNISNADITSKTEAGTLGLALKSVQVVGGICTDYSGNLYVSDREQHIILKITEGGTISKIAGLAGTSGSNTALMNVDGGAARFNGPRGLACDKSGNVYVADRGNNQIRVINKDGKVSLLAGNGSGTAGFVDSTNGNGPAAQFDEPTDVCVDNSGTVYVVDVNNHAIRKITGGSVLTIAGNGVAGDQENVRASSYFNIFDTPSAITRDPEGNIYVCDSANFKIKKITPKGWVFLHSGAGTSGRTLGTAYTSQYVDLEYCDVDYSGNLFVIDFDATNGSRLLKVDYDGVPGVVCDFNAATTYNGGVTGVAVSPGQKLFVTITPPSQISSSSSSSSSGGYSSSSSSSSGGYSSSSSSSS